ncbi:MAG: TonB-dependent receptor [Saprospiraceae bacterium]|nr:TonB-dependent receptor [Saprospiraceae bacterium]
MHWKNLTILIILISCFVFTLQAQEAQTDSTMLVEGPSIVIIAQKDRLLSGVPGSASYIKPLEMKRILPLTGNEVFRKIPGVNVVEEEGLGLRTNIGIRGLDPDRSSNVLVLEDGIPVQLNPYGEPEMYYSPSIDRMTAVEVVKGSGQILFGPRTIGGVINYITADPGAKPEGRVAVKGGSGGYFSTMAQYGATKGNTGFIGNLLYKRADQIGVTGFDILDFNTKINWTTGDKSSISLKFQLYDESSNSTYLGLTQNMFDRNQYFVQMAPDDVLNVKRAALAISHKYFITKNLKLRTTAYGYSIVRNWRRQNFSSNPNAANQTGIVWGDPGISNGAVYMLNDASWRNRSFEVGGLESKLSWEFKIGNRVQQLEAGARLLHEQAHEQELKGNSPTALSGILTTDELRPGRAVSGFVQQKFNLSPKLSVTTGARVEHYSFDRQIQIYKSGNIYRDTNILANNVVSALIPGVGINYAFQQKWSFYGGIHKGFAPPLIKNSISNTGEVFPLDEQESINYEAGIRASPHTGLDFEVGGFLLDFKKQVIPVSESSGSGGSGFANGGRTQHAGIEMAFKVDLGVLLHTSYSIYWEANATYAKSEFAADRFLGQEKVNVRGNVLPYAPQFLSTQTLGFSNFKGFEVQITGNYVSDQFTNQLNTKEASADGRSGIIDAYFLMDGTCRYSFKKPSISFFASIKNLTDARYIASRRPTGIKIGIPRTWIMGVEWVF